MYETNYIADLSASTGSIEDRYEARLRIDNTWGSANLDVSHTNDRSAITMYSAGFNTNFIANSTDVAIGGSYGGDSALIVNVQAEDGDTFDVFVDGAKAGYAIANKASAIPLSSFGEYEVKIIPSKDELYSINERSEMVTLYPGNVETLNYTMEPIMILLGRLLMGGEVMSETKILGSNYPTYTDSNGVFQLEIRSGIETLYMETVDGQFCQVSLVPKEHKKVLKVGNIDLAKDGVCVRADQVDDDLRLAALGELSNQS